MQVLTRSYTTDPMSTQNRKSHKTQSSSGSSQHHKSYHSSGFSTTSKGPRSSDLTTASTLWSPVSNTSSVVSTATIKSNGTVTASNNVINKVAGKGDSIFQMCVTLRKRLKAVPGFDEEYQFTDDWLTGDGPPKDVVSLLWGTFRRGYPLTMILSVMFPNEMPNTAAEQRLFKKDDAAYNKRSKKFTYTFINSVRDVLSKKQDAMPTLTVLYGEDTTGFVKFARIIGLLLDVLDEKADLGSHIFLDPEADDMPVSGKRSKRQHVVDELVNSERTYVQHLEMLSDFKKHIEMSGQITGDAVHRIFINLDPLLDFQRRFLIALEQTNLDPEDVQDWGGLFLRFNEGFGVYKFFIAGQKTSEEAAMMNYDKLKRIDGSEELQQIVESQTHLTAFLLKPFQRLTKYPLLLKELGKTGDFEGDRLEKIETAGVSVTGLLNSMNTYIKRSENAGAYRELVDQVEDWKGHDMKQFGDLLLHGQYPVKKDIGPKAAQAEREFKLYLFENIVVFAKEVTSKKQKLLAGGKPPSIASSKGTSTPRLNLKGRVYMLNLDSVTKLVKPDFYFVSLAWDSEDGHQKMTIRFPSELEANAWDRTLRECQRQARERIEEEKRKAHEKASEEQMRNDSEFSFMQRRERHDDDEGRHMSTDDLSLSGSTIYPSGLSSREDLNGGLSQQASDNSLRSRSTTNDSGSSGQPNLRNPNARYRGPPINTSVHSSVASPMDRVANSYFSPGADSPMSSRTSSSSGMMGFPRQPTQANNWSNEEHNRYTAPAPVIRPLHNSSSSGYHPGDQRGMRAPGQSMATHPASLAQTRMRSASSPDVHSQQQAMLRQAVANAPPVPSVPAHLAGHQPPVNRSQNTTPVYGNGVTTSYATHSPPANSRQGSQVDLRHAAKKSIGGYDPRASQQTDISSRTFSPPPSSTTGFAFSMQFKTKIMVPSEGTTFIITVPPNITFETLRDRIETKLHRITNLTFDMGVKLQFIDDDDGEYITMQTDEDVQTVFEQWRELHSRDSTTTQQLGEITLYCNKT